MISFFLILIMLSSWGIKPKGALIIFLLTITASFSTYYRRYIKFTLGFETVTFATVIATVAYGPTVGIAVGLVSAFAAEFIPQMIDPSSFLWIFSYVLVALATWFLHGWGVPVFWLGMVASFIQNAVAEPIRIFSGDDYLRGMGIFSVVGSTMWNILLFSVLAGPVLSIV